MTVVGALFCALAIGFLWGFNIGTVGPFVEVVFEGRSLQDWVASEIVDAEESSQTLASEIEDLRKQRAALDEDQRASIDNEILVRETRYQAELSALQARRWIQPYVNQYSPSSPFQTLILVVLVLIVGTLIKDVLLIISNLMCGRLSHLGTLRLRTLFYRRTLRMDLVSFSQTGSSELISRFTYDMQLVSQGLQTLFGRALREPLKMVCCFAGAAFICWRLLFFSLLVAPLVGFLIGRLSKSIKRANRRAMEEMAQIYDKLSETIGAIKAVKAFTMERHERRRFLDSSKKFYRKAMRIALYDSLVRPATELLGIFTISLAILAGAYLVLNQETHLFGIQMSDRPLSISALLMFFALLAGASDPARKLSDMITRLQRAAAAADRIYEMLDREPAIKNPVRPVYPPRHQKDIVFEDVHFAYPDGEPVLRGVNLTIPFNETVAIVGPNGCGKSTLANLILRFYDPLSGAVRLDGVNLRDMRINHLRKQIGVVTQETLLFNDTVEANIRYGLQSATRDEVIAAAKQAHAHSFIEEKLDDGYQTIVGENANRLSGGQRQRISLARAMLRDPSILLLDEATSQVDLESEQVINRILADFVTNRTSIIITHRLSILDLADRIIVMDAGRIADIGTRQELAKRCDLFRRLCQIPMRASA